MPLTFQYCSDLHLEFDLNRKNIAKYPMAVKGDILLLAGDIVPFKLLDQHQDFFDFAAHNYTATYWIPGNHEYYGGDISNRSGVLHEAIRDNVFLVNNTTVTIEDVDLICSTLWSAIDPVHEWEITRAMSDFHVIKNNGEKLTIAEYNLMHRQCRKYVEDAIANSKSRHKMVMTHHIPTLLNYPAKFVNSPLYQAFAIELHDLIRNSGIDYWIYGHHHSTVPDFTIGKTTLTTNQLGYVKHGEHTEFDRGKTITIA
jgi:predicted phosphohydrolase